MADVASAAGVAISTVSRALSNPDRVNEATRQRILDAARSLSYIPNAMARNLRRGATETAMVVVPGCANAPVFNDLLAGIEERMSAAGYRLVVGRLDQASEAGRLSLDPALSGTVDGAFLVSPQVPHFAERSLAQTGIPLIGLMFDLSDAGIPSVLIDERHWVREAAARLIALGHRDIAYIAGAANGPQDGLRRAGILDAMDAAGLPRAGLLRLVGDTTFASGATAARHCLGRKRMPTAVIGSTDEMAIGFMKELRAAGIDVPGQCSVMGCDGIAFADYCEPTLSVIRQPLRAIGGHGADLMLQRLRGEALRAEVLLHQCTIKMRESAAAAPVQRRRPAARPRTRTAPTSAA